jgi:hypothetical protein
MDMDLDDLDKFDANMHTSLWDLFPIARKTDEQIVYIKDGAYEFSVKPDAIELVKKKSTGKMMSILVNIRSWYMIYLIYMGMMKCKNIATFWSYSLSL